MGGGWLGGVQLVTLIGISLKNSNAFNVPK